MTDFYKLNEVLNKIENRPARKGESVVLTESKKDTTYPKKCTHTKAWHKDMKKCSICGEKSQENVSEAKKKSGKKPDWLTTAEEKAEKKKQTKESLIAAEDDALLNEEFDEPEDYDDEDEFASSTTSGQLEEIMYKIEQLVQNAKALIQSNQEYRSAYSRARSYWIPTILGCLDGNATMYSMQSTIEEIAEIENNPNDEDPDDGSLNYAAKVNGIK